MSSIRQKVVQGQTEAITARLLVDGDPVNLTSASCVVYSPSGTSLATPTPTTSAEVATVSQAWPSATYKRAYHFRADFTLNYSGGSKLLNVFFDVVKRRFESMLTDQDILDTMPALTIPTASQDLSKYREFAWRYIERKLINRLPKGVYIEDVAKPEDFRDAHYYGTVWKIFEARAFDGQGSYNWDSSEKYRVMADQEIMAVMNRMALDTDQSMFINEDTETFNISNIKIER